MSFDINFTKIVSRGPWPSPLETTERRKLSHENALTSYPPFRSENDTKVYIHIRVRNSIFLFTYKKDNSIVYIMIPILMSIVNGKLHVIGGRTQFRGSSIRELEGKVGFSFEYVP